MTKHTPGPWRVEEYGNGGAVVIGEARAREVIAVSLTERNANLIAAAPDLLAACEAFVEAEHAAILDGQRAFSMYIDAIDAAKAAIAKARGET